MSKKLISTINHFTKLPPMEAVKLLDFTKPLTIQKGTYFIREGQIPRQFGFVETGLFRYLYLKEEGKELTKAFMPAGNFISAYSAMIQQEPAHFFIEALETSTVISIDYQKWKALKAKHPAWNEFLVGMLEMGYGVKEKREREFLLLDAESRYRVFLKEYPLLEKRIKQHMIASYIGITPIALSRIRKKMGLINLG